VLLLLLLTRLLDAGNGLSDSKGLSVHDDLTTPRTNYSNHVLSSQDVKLGVRFQLRAFHSLSKDDVEEGWSRWSERAAFLPWTWKLDAKDSWTCGWEEVYGGGHERVPDHSDQKV